MKLLLVEDNLALMDMLVTSLARLGYDISQASSIAESKRVLDSVKPAVIVLDMNLPNGFGAATVAAIKRHAPSIPIVAMTGYGKEVGVEAIAAGANVFMCKGDVLASDIDAAVKQAIEVERRFAPVQASLDSRDRLLRENAEDSKNIMPPKAR